MDDLTECGADDEPRDNSSWGEGRRSLVEDKLDVWPNRDQP